MNIPFILACLGVVVLAGMALYFLSVWALGNDD